MQVRRWFSPVASAAAITLLGSLTAFAVEGATSDRAAEVELVGESQGAPFDEGGDDLVFTIEVDTSGDDVEDDGDAGRPEDAPDNHGQTVSEFARVTSWEMGLTGCERGHAISAVARGADPEDPQSSDLYVPCREGDEDEDEDELDSEDDGEAAGRRGGPPHGYAGPPPGKGPNGDGPAAASRGRSGR